MWNALESRRRLRVGFEFFTFALGSARRSGIGGGKIQFPYDRIADARDGSIAGREGPDTYLLPILLRLENPDVRQLAVLAVEVKAIANHEQVLLSRVHAHTRSRRSEGFKSHDTPGTKQQKKKFHDARSQRSRHNT